MWKSLILQCLVVGTAVCQWPFAPSFGSPFSPNPFSGVSGFSSGGPSFDSDDDFDVASSTSPEVIVRTVYVPMYPDGTQGAPQHQPIFGSQQSAMSSEQLASYSQAPLVPATTVHQPNLIHSEASSGSHSTVTVGGNPVNGHVIPVRVQMPAGSQNSYQQPLVQNALLLLVPPNVPIQGSNSQLLQGTGSMIQNAYHAAPMQTQESDTSFVQSPTGGTPQAVYQPSVGYSPPYSQTFIPSATTYQGYGSSRGLAPSPTHTVQYVRPSSPTTVYHQTKPSQSNNKYMYYKPRTQNRAYQTTSVPKKYSPQINKRKPQSTTKKTFRSSSQQSAGRILAASNVHHDFRRIRPTTRSVPNVNVAPTTRPIPISRSTPVVTTTEQTTEAPFTATKTSVSVHTRVV